MIALDQPLQNGTKYMIELCDFDGVRVAPPLDQVLYFWTSRAVNAFGAWELALPYTFNKSLLIEDRRVKFWRKPVGGPMYQEFEGLIKLFDYSADRTGAITRVIGGPSVNYIASGRVIAAQNTTAGASKTGAADNLIKAFVRENLGASASAGRALSATLFSVQSDVGLGQSLTVNAAYLNMFDVIRDLANASRQLGTELYFDVVPVSDTQLEFRTYTGQRGVDRSGVNGITFSQEAGNLTEPRYQRDGMSEITDSFGLGKGDWPFRDIQSAQDAARSTFSPFSRREAVVNAASDDSAGVLAKARAQVMDGRPRIRFSGKLQSVPGFIYGKDWNFGDKANASFDDEQYVIMVRSVKCSVSGQNEETVESLAEVYQ